MLGLKGMSPEIWLPYSRPRRDHLHSKNCLFADGSYQDLPLFKQFDQGVRFIDLRIYYVNSTIRLVHGLSTNILANDAYSCFCKARRCWTQMLNWRIFSGGSIIGWMGTPRRLSSYQSKSTTAITALNSNKKCTA